MYAGCINGKGTFSVKIKGASWIKPINRLSGHIPPSGAGAVGNWLAPATAKSPAAGEPVTHGDGHQRSSVGFGCEAAIDQVLNATWQRCCVHFMCNVLVNAGKRGCRIVSAFAVLA